MLEFSKKGFGVTKRKKTRKAARPKKRKRLLDQVIQLTGIPSQTIRRELQAIIHRHNISPEELTLDQLRTVAASYLREIMGGLLETTHLKRQDRTH